jgi:hypothetical protein
MKRASVQAVVMCALAFLVQSCVYRFANQERSISEQPRTLYIAPITDSTVHSGQAAQLMMAIRQRVLRDRNFELTSLEDARWGLEIRITESYKAITRTEKCDQGNETLASGSVACALIKDENIRPDVSPEEEIATMSFRARGVDLSTGAVLFDLSLPSLTSGSYDLVGDGTVKASLSQKQELHLLRYFENSDRAMRGLAEAAAQRIFDRLNAVPPPAPEY